MFGVSPSVEYSSPSNGFIASLKLFVCPGTVIPICSVSIKPPSTTCPFFKTPFPKINEVVLSTLVSRVNRFVVLMYCKEYGTAFDSVSPVIKFC